MPDNAVDAKHQGCGLVVETRLDVVSARNDSEQAGIGWCLVIGILDQHSHFATDALRAHRHRQSQEIMRPLRSVENMPDEDFRVLRSIT
jgi:hypothetical protein